MPPALASVGIPLNQTVTPDGESVERSTVAKNASPDEFGICTVGSKAEGVLSKTGENVMA